MKITQVEVVEPDEKNSANYYWVLIHTDEGITGLGETYHGLKGAAKVCIEAFGEEVLIGKDPSDIEGLFKQMFHRSSYHGQQGAEFRAMSAIDMALWDIKGKALGAPIYQLLGGKCRESVPVYYSGGLGRTPREREAIMDRARWLVENGWKAFKGGLHPRFRPLDHYLDSATKIKEDIEVLRWVREAVGDTLEICVDCHASWDVPSAIRAAKALEEIDALFMEEPIGPDNADAMAEVARSTRTPICTGERLFGRFRFLELLEKHACDVIMPDLAWTGGISETRKIAYLAETYYIPIAPHNYGPVTCMALVHVMAHVPNTRYLEFTANHYEEWEGVGWNRWVNKPIVAKESALPLPTEPGLGIELSDEVMERHRKRKC
jgi:galactonate dehydratase